ncbi:nitroreductase family deazaflavin-dependent oxidoreductase [Mycolicibacterium sp. SCSIO 43805]|uniref:nitroreductase family deazaflavin-dependent oxidoreductase n=1 Tax=Mycolicibacterium sp. SCSIO 43805 TaxID=3378074 RepID=UPI003AB812E7
MQLPQWLARFNRHVTNPIQRMWAGWAPTMGILTHVGRRSGRPYRTPLTVFSTRDGVAVLLTYGPDRDWLKNITAAGGGTMRRHGRSFPVTDSHWWTISVDRAYVLSAPRARRVTAGLTESPIEG